MEREWVPELVIWLRQRLVELCRTIGQPIPFSGLRISPQLGIEESKYFLMGLEAGLFWTDSAGAMRTNLLLGPTRAAVKEKVCPIFSYDPLPPRLVRERICLLSTASTLVMKRGWLPIHIEIEPDLRDSSNENYGIDLLIKSRDGRILTSVEIKRSLAELQKLALDLRACCARGPHARIDCGFPQNHPTYEFCASYKPAYFWGVAPDADVCFRMKYDGPSIALEQLRSLPPRSLMES
jgi:hypothetical protein